MIELADITLADAVAIEALLDAAFGADRRQRTAYRLRAGTTAIAPLSIAAFHGGALVGSLQSWPLELAPADGMAPVPIVLVGPVAVLPERQRDGIGRMLMTDLLVRAHARDARALTLIGDPEYYGRFFGFTATATGGWLLPGPVERRRLLARAEPGTALPSAATLRARLPVPA